VSITAGSVVLTWMCLGSGGSIWIVALWHTAFNLVTATSAGADLAAPLLSAAVIAAAIVLLRHAHTDSSERPAGHTAHANDNVGPSMEPSPWLRPARYLETAETRKRPGRGR
jgi:hypothetical protein